MGNFDNTVINQCPPQEVDISPDTLPIQNLTLNPNNGRDSSASVSSSSPLPPATVIEIERKEVESSPKSAFPDLKANWDFPFKFGDISWDEVLKDLGKPNGSSNHHQEMSVSSKSEGRRQEILLGKPVFDSQLMASDCSFLKDDLEVLRKRSTKNHDVNFLR